ncbi:uncharacterized protein B0I36DRAFT_250793 [Microdochium trichocladiopsis]|uniref:Uncharacterized protein n=1 Tax=Microdochium trichocladiopsis TaxID=1682393 RepID=A0A9P9BM98_9PEZI|nr:uncharacterized protein B0I36DRAFT_250793 [Microdochium trichocladiopsis]KAH7025270.1 hypothetical protein B0I36DRAFT_250793 [Microdochium trichocladiopsis]
MAFVTPAYVPSMPFEVPDDVPVQSFLLKDDSRYGRRPLAQSKPPFTCGVSGLSYSVAEVSERVESLARALSHKLSLQVDTGNELDKVISIFSVNTANSLVVSWATHRLDGVSNYASATYTVAELVYQLEKVKPLALFTCTALLDKAYEAAATVGIPRDRIFLLPTPVSTTGPASLPVGIETVDDLINEGRGLEPLPVQQWQRGRGASQVAYLCGSSGTSGLPKFVKLSHKNVIANILQIATYEKNHRGADSEYCLGLLPFSHNLSLIAVAHLAVYRGDGVVVLSSFELQDMLQAIQDYQMGRLWLIPPVLMTIIRARDVVRKYDISSVNTAVVGAASLSEDIAAAFDSVIPGCKLIQGYGLTETTVAVTLTNPADDMFCSCGSLLPGVEGRLVNPDGSEITKHETPGELQVRTPTVMLGYLNNDTETSAMLTPDGWLRTGDLVEFRKSKNGHDHVFFVDRMKELIKVRGMQVSPTEVENHLMAHPKILTAVVVPIPDELAGELPLAFIVRSPEAEAENANMLKLEIDDHVKGALAAHKHLAGGIEFVAAVPKTGSGKIQRKVLKGMALSICKARQAAKDPVNAAVFVFDSDGSSDFTDSDDDDLNDESSDGFD